MKKLFLTTLSVRLIWVIFAYYFYILMTGSPLGFETSDANVYDVQARQILQAIDSPSLSGFLDNWYIHYSDLGQPVFLSLIYFFLYPKLVVVWIVNAFLSAGMVIMIYRLGKRNFGESVGRLAGIMAILLPQFFYYTSTTLKETVMVFLCVGFIDQADILLRGSIVRIKSVILLLLIAVSLFFFRTVLAFALIFSFFTAILLATGKNLAKWGKRFFLALWIILGIFFFMSDKIIHEINYYYASREANLIHSMDYRSERKGGNEFAKYGSAVVFAPVILIAPFPTFTLANVRQKGLMMMSGGYFVRNVIVFFIYFSLLYLYRERKLRQHLLIVSFVFCYMAILANSGFALSGRFHMPVIPFILILSSLGMDKIDTRNIKYFNYYLVLIGFIIIAWNWFKLAGRDMI